MDVTPLRSVRGRPHILGTNKQRVVVDLTVGENGKLEPGNLCFSEGREPHMAGITDLTTPLKIGKSKPVSQDFSGQNSHCNQTVEKNVSQPQVGTVMSTLERRRSLRFKEVPHTATLVDLTIEKNATPSHVIKAKPVKQNFSAQNSHCKVVDLTVDKNISQPPVATVMLTSEHCSPRHTEVPHTAVIIDLTSKKNAALPQNVKSKPVKQNSSGQNCHCEVVNRTVDDNVCQPQVRTVKLTLERRCSPRLQELLQDKRLCYGSDNKRPSSSTKDKVCSEQDTDKSLKRQLDAYESNQSKKKPTKYQSGPSTSPDLAMIHMEIKGSKSNMSDGSVLPAPESTTFIEFKDSASLKWTNYDQFIADSMNGKASSKVKATVRTFNQRYLHFVQEEEKRFNKFEEKGTLNAEKNFGHIPGIPIGHKFFSEAEIAALGFQRHWLNGINYIQNLARNMKKHKGYFAPLAVAIMLSSEHEDDADGLTEVIYIGQGGNDLHGDMPQVKDQAMLCGNFALKNNMEQDIAVRVFRGRECAKSYSRKVYTYCGLYKVERHWAEKDASGFDIFTYRLVLKPLLQPKLNVDQVKFEQGKGLSGSSFLPGLICDDMSFGEEVLPVPVTNVVDNEIISTGFKYFTSVQYSPTIPIPSSGQGCKCKGKCSNRHTCSCARRNGSDFPYVVEKDGGRLVEPKDVVYECGPRCGCGPSCLNRSSQRPLKYRLEVYRTEKKGWAVRSWDLIPSGAPVIEYTGIIRRNDDLDNVLNNEFIFEIDCWHTMHGLGGRKRRQDDDSSSSSLQSVDERTAESESEFCVDGGNSGNVSRFINHSCDPNLFVQCILSSHHDMRLARIVLFAADDIPPMEELTYDYGYALDSVVGPDGKLKHMTCYCGTSECRGRLY